MLIIKYPFWNYTNSNKKATYVCINYGESFCPDEIKKQAILISGDSGLIGTPQASMQGINFKCLLMPGLKVGGMVQIQSRKLQLLNGLYKVQTLQMQGGNRSNPYFCNVFAIRM